MPQRYDYSGLGNSIGRMGDMISSHVMRMPAIRHQLAVEAGNAARQNALAATQMEENRAQARKGNASAALDEDELSAATELQKVMSAPDAIQTNANGSVTISPTATGSLMSLLARAGTRGRNFGAGSRDLLTARNAPAEAEANRVAASDRSKYSVDEREATRRDAPIVLRDDARLVTPAGEQLGGLGLHKLNADQSLVGDGGSATSDHGPELKRLGTGVAKPTTPQGDSNFQRFKGNILLKKASGEITPEQASAALQEYGAGGQVPGVRQAAAGYKIGARYKGGLVYLGGDPADQASWQPQ